jgi:hypothetical protein
MAKQAFVKNLVPPPQLQSARLLDVKQDRGGPED